MSEPYHSRKAPFCCGKIIPQPPFYKYENYPRSYMCVHDFIYLATSIPGLVPTSKLTKSINAYDFVIRLCKGGRDPAVGPNQLSSCRYYVPDATVEGGLIEVVKNESPNCIHLEEMLKDPRQATYVHLEDVWMTLLCPEHVGIVWFVQFFVRNARGREELELVTRRVRARRSADPNFVEDEFTVRFNEMRGLPNRRPNPRVDGSRSSRRPGAEGLGDGRLHLWRYYSNDAPTVLESSGLNVFEHKPDSLPPISFEHPPGVTQTATDPSIFLSGERTQFGNVGGNLEDFFHAGDNQHGLGAGMMSNCIAGPSPNTRNRQSDISGRMVQDIAGRRGATSGPSLTSYSELICGLEAPPPVHPSASPSPLETRFGGQPYSIYRPESPVPPLAYQRPVFSGTAAAEDDDWWEDINPIGGFSSQTSPFRHASYARVETTGCRDDRLGPSPEALTSSSETQRPIDEAQVGSSRDTSVSSASPWAPSAGNTTGLRPVERRTWDIEAKKWRTYWVWAL